MIKSSLMKTGQCYSGYGGLRGTIIIYVFNRNLWVIIQPLTTDL